MPVHYIVLNAYGDDFLLLEQNPANTFPGTGEMATRCRAFDWASTPIGPVEQWPQSLKTTVATILASRHPMFLWWGPELIQIYNDAYRPSFASGGRHERALGARGKEFWTEIWDIIGPQIDGVMTRGESTWHEDQLVPIERNGRIEEVYWTYSYSPVFDDEGNIGGTLVVCTETTKRVLENVERERLIEAERQARIDAESASRARTEFLAVMSHELRTPLNAIGGYAELIELGVRGPTTPEQQTDLKRIRTSQRHLLGLINSVLNYTRIEAGMVDYSLSSMSVDEVLTTCETLTAPQMESRQLKLGNRSCDPNVTAHADQEKVQQIVLNLMTNAIKFTEPGGTISLACTEDASHIFITVSDTGRGIAETQLSRVFEPFVQIDAKLTRTNDGVGLGLAISRDLARGMGGDLKAQSIFGEGSTFTLSLPKESPQTV